MVKLTDDDYEFFLTNEFLPLTNSLIDKKTNAPKLTKFQNFKILTSLW